VTGDHKTMAEKITSLGRELAIEAQLACDGLEILA
jgi:hypothetical protein